MKTKRDTLVDIFSAVLPGLAKKDGLPQSQSFVFVDGEVVTFNDRVTIHHPLPAELKDLSGAVKATEMYRILAKIPPGTEVDVEMTDAEMVIKTPSIQVRVRRDTEIVNKYSTVGVPKKFKTIPEGLLDGVKAAMFSASTDLSKPLLTHIYVRGNKAHSTDNRRLTIITFKGDADAMFIPAAVVGDLLSYKPVQYSVTEGWIHWKNKDGVLFSFRTLEGEYPDIEKFFDDTSAWTEVTFPSGIDQTVERVAEALDKTQLLPMVTVVFKNKMVVISGQGPYATVKERLATSYEGELTFRIAAEFFEDVLRLGATARVGNDRMCLETPDLLFRHLICLPKATVAE